ncbi:MAG: DUF2007 domain-containing protein [Bacteroidales bacterium]|nr:DUF2007 domain-containing protein [Bacteroidales bacterium]
MDKNWVKIFSTSENYKAEILKGLLLENNIEAVIINKKDSAYLFGELELYVRMDNVLKAKRIITTHNEK